MNIHGDVDSNARQNGPPPYPGEVKLVIALPSHIPRYLNIGPTQLNANTFPTPIVHSVIPPATILPTLSVHDDVGGGWKRIVHPEGDVYYHHPEKRITTPIDPCNQTNKELLERAFSTFLQKLRGEILKWHTIDIVFFCDPTPGTQPGSPINVNYYAADYENRQIFWLDTVNPSDVGVLPGKPLSVLKSALTPEFWTHVDYFPGHTDFLEDAANELIGALSQGAIDEITSPGSTCPYSYKECNQFLSILRPFQETPTSTANRAYRNACIARLWTSISRARHINSYGQTNARLDRLQTLGQQENSKYSPLLSLLEVATFLAPLSIHSRLSTLFIGRVVYQRHWQVFFDDMRRNWSQMCALSVTICMGNILLFSKGSTTLPGIASTSLAGASTFAALYLHNKHPEYLLKTGPDISTYIMSVESYWFGLRPLAIVLAVPQALAIYSALAFQVALLSLLFTGASSVDQSIKALAAVSTGIVPVVVTMNYFSGNTRT